MLNKKYSKINFNKKTIFIYFLLVCNSYNVHDNDNISEKCIIIMYQYYDTYYCPALVFFLGIYSVPVSVPPYLDDSPIRSPQGCHCVLLHRHHGDGGQENVPETAVKPVFTWIGSFNLQPVTFVVLPTANGITNRALQKKIRSLNTKNSTCKTSLME